MYAIWTQNKYQVTFNTNGGSSVENKEVTYDLAYGSLPSTTKTGYTFAGWYLDNETFKNKIEETTKVTTPNNHTLYAKWDIITYKITYNLNDGTLENANKESYTIETPSFTLNNPQKEGYTFIGWTGSNGNEASKTVTIEKGSTSDKQYIANWEANKYTVSFNSNGGNDIASKEVTFGQNYGDLEKPKKQGFTFAGWYLDNETFKNKIETTTKVGIANNHTLYAKWTEGESEYIVEHYKQNIEDDQYGEPEVETLTAVTGSEVTPATKDYGKGFETPNLKSAVVKADGSTIIKYYYNRKLFTVTFNTNGGNSVENITAKYEKEVTLPTTSKTGYTFKGWLNQELEVTSPYKVEDNVTLSAKWNVITYNITYSLNGGNLEEGITNPKNYTIETASFTLNNPQKDGYTFTGWTGSNGTTPNTTVTISKGTTGDKEFIANWKANEYIVTFNPDEGTVNPSSKTVTYNENYGQLPTPIKTGYKFNGWYTGLNGAGTKITDQSIVTITANQTLYASWSVNSYTITYNANGGSGAPGSQTKKYNESLTLSATKPTRTGYTFKGWGLNGSATEVKYNPADTIGANTISNDLVLYAIWEINKYTITYNANGGNSTPEPTTANYNETIQMPSASRKYTVTFNTNGGTALDSQTSTYQFTGWYTDATNGTKKEYKTMPAYNETLYAHWDDTKSSITIGTTTKEGYTFAGWYIDEDLKTQLTTNENGTYLPTKDITIYAKWNANKYVVTFDPGEGTVNPTTKEVTYDSTYGELPVAKLTGYGFGGWYTKQDGQGEEIKSSTIVKITSNQTLYARWAQGQYVVKHYKQNIDGTYPSVPTDVENKSAVPGNKVTPPTKDTTQGSYLGFSAPQTQTKEITEDGNTEFIYKYERKSYDLNINPNGGKYEGSQSTVTVTQKFESTYTVSDKIEAPAGYVVTFKNFGGQDNYTKKTSTKTFTNWTKTGQGTLSGNVYTYGAGIGTIVANYKNDSIEMPDDPTHEGYTFTGWYLDEQCTNKVSLNTDKTYTPSQNITLYSGWSINKYALTISRLSGNTTKEQNYNTQLDLSTYNTSGYKVTLNPNYEGGANTVLTQTHKSWSKDGFGTLSGNIYTYGAGNGKVTENYNDVTLTTPTQAGYTFVGWYTDLELKNEVKLNADNTYTPTSNITLYAKWTANTNTKYTVKHYKQNIDGTYPSVPSEEEVKYGTTKETTNADPKTYKGFTTPAKQNKEILANGTTIIEYKYVRDLSTLTINPNGGTYSKDLNIEQAYESTYVVDNANITPPKGYTVTYNANGGTTEVGSEVSTKTFEGWVLTGGGKFVGNTYTFGTKDEEGTLTANYKNNSISLTTAKKVGYTFTGWYLDSNCTQALVLNADGTYTPQKDITIYAGWSANQVTYKVYRYLENANNENYTLYGDVIEGKAAAGSTLILLTEANKNQIANTKYVGANLTGGTLGVGTSITTTTVAPDGTTNIYLYYDRNEYTLTLEKNEYIETVTGAGTYKWGATVAINATVKTNITGYNASVWDKWTLTEGNGVTVPTTIKGNIVMTAGNITIVANAVKGTPITYSVVYNGSGATGGTTASSTHTYDKAQNLTANGYKKEYTVTFNYNYSGSTNTVATYKYDFVNWKDSNNNTYLDKASVINLAKTSGAIVTLNANWQEGENDPLPSAKRTGYGLAGWYTDKECTDANKVGDPGASYKVNANTTLYAKWEEGQVEYTVKYYIQNIEGTGYDLKDTEIKAGKTGTTTNATPKTYVGFTTPEEKTATIAADSSTVIEYYYTRNSYTLTLAKNEHVKEVSATGEVSGITNTSKSYKYGENIDLSATLNDIAGYTYTFVNWASNNTSLVANTTQKDAKITMPAGNVTLTANGSRTIQNYTITYNLNGGALVAGKTNPTSYNVESQNITLNNPQKTGYTFTGWTGSNGATPSTTVTIAKGSTGNKNYTANYNVNQYEVTYIDVVGSTTGKVLGTSKENVNFGTQVTGASKGTDVTVGKYYAGYVYSSATTATVTTSGATVYRIFTAYDKTKYTVEHYVMKTDGTYDTAATKVDSTKTGTTDSEVTIANLKDSTLLVTNGIYYSYGQVDGKTVTSTTIKGDGTRVIKLYYARTSGTLKTVAGENIESVTVQNSVKYYYGATVPSLTAKTMAIEGHTVTFSKWTSNNGTYVKSSTVNPYGTFTWPAIPDGTSITLTASASKTPNKYEVTYKDVVGSTTGKVLGTSKESANFGTQVTGASKGTDVTVGKYYAGYVYSSATTATVTTSGATVYRIFTAYDKTKYTVEHYVMKTDGTYDTAATKVDSTKTGTTDSEVTIANLKDSTLLVTNGIYYSYGQVDGKTVTSTTIKGDGTRVIKLYYARTSGTLKTVAGENIESVTVQNSVKYYYGATVPSLTAKTMAIEGHTVTFSKWTSNNGTYVKSSTVNPYGTFTWPAIPDGTSITLTASASKTPNKYEVTYKDVVGSTTGKVLGTNKESVNFGTQVTGASKGTDTTEGAYYKGYLYDSSTTATVTTSGATVYRIFKPSTNTKYIVSRYLENANDNTYTLYDTTTKTGTTDSTLTLSTEAKSLEIANTTFAGGNLVGGTSGVGTAITSTTVKPDGSTKIYLYYTRNKFTLELSKNDYISSVTGAGSYKWGQNVTIKANVKANDIYYIYGFANWTKDGVQYETESTKQFSMGTQNLSLVANGKIVQGQEYTVTFEPKGGTITTNTKKVNYSSTYGNLPAVNGQEGLTAKTYTLTYNYKYTGKANSSKQYACSLNGWYKEKAYTNIVTSASKVTTASNHTLYAKWNNPSVTLETPVRAGYTFDGWYTDESLKTKAGNGGASYSIGANTTLYAKWIANTDTKYTVVHKKMNLDGTYPEGNSPIAGKIEVVEKAGTTDSNVTPETNTYTGFTAPEKQTVTIKGDGTTVVVYEYSRNKYTFTLGTMAGVSNAGSTATGSYYYETAITLKATVNTGYTWSKWESSNTSMQANITGQSGSFTMPAGNITMTPKVTANTYTVNYNGNGATGGTTASSTHTYDKAQNLTLNGYVRQYTVTFNENYEGSTNQTAKSTYAFKDWNLKNDGTGNSYTNGQSVTNLTSTNNGTVTLYAMWDNTVNSAKITLPMLSRENYIFEGWYKEKSALTFVGEGGNSYIPEEDIILYAKWSLANYSVTTKNGTYYFKTLAEAVEKADSDGSTITILQTNTDASTVIIDKNVTINTNGKTVTRNATITVNSAKTVTIDGTGGFTTSTTNTFTLNGGNLTVNDGTIYSSGAVAIGQTGAGTINILGGTIKGKTAAISSLQAATVNIGNSSNSTVSTETPVIEATAGYGINLTGTSSKLNFNCGVIKGTSKTTYNGIDVAFNVAGTKAYRSGYGAGTTLSNLIYSTILVKTNLKVEPEQCYLNTTTNNKMQLTVSGDYLGTLTYTCDDANIASVSDKGLITAKKSGTCIITITEANGGATANCKVIVDDKLPVWTISIESISDTISIASDPKQCYLNTTTNKTKQLTIVGNNEGNLIYTSEDNNIATVSSTGLITALKEGECTITIQDDKSGAMTTCNVIIDNTLPIWTVTTESITDN